MNKILTTIGIAAVCFLLVGGCADSKIESRMAVLSSKVDYMQRAVTKIEGQLPSSNSIRDDSSLMAEFVDAVKQMARPRWSDSTAEELDAFVIPWPKFVESGDWPPFIWQPTNEISDWDYLLCAELVAKLIGLESQRPLLIRNIRGVIWLLSGMLYPSCMRDTFVYLRMEQRLLQGCLWLARSTNLSADRILLDRLLADNVVRSTSFARSMTKEVQLFNTHSLAELIHSADSNLWGQGTLSPEEVVMTMDYVDALSDAVFSYSESGNLDELFVKNPVIYPFPKIAPDSWKSEYEYDRYIGLARKLLSVAIASSLRDDVFTQSLAQTYGIEIVPMQDITKVKLVITDDHLKGFTRYFHFIELRYELVIRK